MKPDRFQQSVDVSWSFRTRQKEKDTASWNVRRLAREILFEDARIIVFNKGYGLTVQGDPDAKSLVHQLPALAVRRCDQLKFASGHAVCSL